jgi:hypothetical protein
MLFENFSAVQSFQYQLPAFGYQGVRFFSITDDGKLGATSFA